MLNLADWMVQDEELIRIRSKVIRYNDFPIPDDAKLRKLRLINGFGGIGLLLLIAALRAVLRRRGAK